MNVEELREYCLSLTQTKENMPWTEPQYSMLATFTVGDKWFCLADLDKKFIDVKCEPNMIAEMQSKYKGAFPAWHMNKEHWLGVKLDSDIPDSIIRSLLKEGYHLIVSKLPRKILEGIRLYRNRAFPRCGDGAANLCVWSEFCQSFENGFNCG